MGNNEKESMKLLLTTDLDRTLLPNGLQQESPGARSAFTSLVKNRHVCLVYVTGRSLELTEKAIKEYTIPVPDILIADVGSTLYHRDMKSWQRNQEWDRLLSRDWHQVDSNGLANLLHNIPGLRLQENDRLTRFKLSYYVQDGADIEGITDSITTLFARKKIKASLIWSHDEMANQELLDILPACADKYQALQFLRQHLKYELNEMLFSGDSGNDLEVLASDIPAVLVANARQEVVKKAKAMAAEAGNSAELYIANGGYQGMNGYYAAGILEGVNHYYTKLIQSQSTHSDKMELH
jgi:hypothetical protein